MAGEPTTWFEMARWCLQHGDFVMSTKEVQFVRNMCGLLYRDAKPSERQRKWLGDIVHRIKQRRGDYGPDWD